MILETYAPESSCQSQIIYKDPQHSSRRWTRRGGHSRSCHTRERASYPLERAGSVEDHSSIPVGVVAEIHTTGSACCHHPTQASSESPMVGPDPAVALAVQDSLLHFHSLLILQQFQPTIVPSSGHVPFPCPHTPLSSPGVET